MLLGAQGRALLLLVAVVAGHQKVLAARALDRTPPEGSLEAALAAAAAGDSIDMLVPSSGAANLARMLLTNF